MNCVPPAVAVVIQLARGPPIQIGWSYQNLGQLHHAERDDYVAFTLSLPAVAGVKPLAQVLGFKLGSFEHNRGWLHHAERL